MEQTSVMDFAGGVSKAYVESDMLASLAADPIVQYMSKADLQKAIDKTKKEMNTAAKDMDFLQATKLRDEMFALENILKDKS
jgi:excinuclease ABC subunit B